MTAADRRFALRSFVAFAALLLVASFLAHTWRFFDKKFYITTGEAEWIWVRDPMSKEKPVAFFATRDFAVPSSATQVKINIAADPSYTLYFNGKRIGVGGLKTTRSIDVYDATALRRAGQNRIVVGCRSAKGAGGLLLSVDFGGMQRNGVFTDRSWHLYRSWEASLLDRDPGASSATLRSFGTPPVGRWNYPTRTDVPLAFEPDTLLQPRDVVSFTGEIPETRILSGIAVASAEKVQARAFDFGPVEGFARLTRDGEELEVIRIRYANAPEELSRQGEIVPVVFAKGERSVVDATRRSFRYVIVYGDRGSVDVEPLRR